MGALRRNLLETVLPQLRRLGFACEEKRSEKLLIVRRRGRENRFYLFGGANEASAALIQGMTLAGVLFDEAALMPRSFVEQASARCSVEGSRLWFSCNPEGPNHWFYREWVCRAEEKRALYLHFTMADNPSLSARVRARYESMYSGIFYRRFVLGEWTAAEGRIYDFYAPGEYAQEAPAEPWERLRVSVDYGTVNPTSMGLWALKDGVWYRVDEYYYDSRTEGRQKTDEEYVDALEELTRGRRIERVIVDPSAASFIETLRRRGFRVMRANNAVADGLRVTADLLKKRRLVICRSAGLPAGDGELRMGERRERTRRAAQGERSRDGRDAILCDVCGGGARHNADRVRGDKNDELERSGRTVKRRKKEQTAARPRRCRCARGRAPLCGAARLYAARRGRRGALPQRPRGGADRGRGDRKAGEAQRRLPRAVSRMSGRRRSWANSCAR